MQPKTGSLPDVTSPDAPRWVTVAEAAREIGEHRTQLHRMISNGTFPHTHLDRSGPRTRILLTPDLARKVQGCKRLRIG